MAGTIVAQAIPLVVAPLLTRIYTPEQFGTFSFYLSVTALLCSFATARYEVAVPLAERDKDAASLAALAVATTLIFSLFLAGFLLIAYSLSLDFGLPAEVTRLAVFLPIVAVLTGVGQALRFLSLRHERFKAISIGAIWQSASSSLLQIVLGILALGPAGLATAQAAGQWAFNLKLAGWGLVRTGLSSTYRRARLIVLARRYAGIVVYGLPALLVSRAAQESLIILAGYHLAPEITGYIALLNRIVGIPSSIIGNSLGEVFYQQVSRVTVGESKPKIIRFVLTLCSLSILIFSGLYITLNLLFVWVFGPDWEAALTYLPFVIITSAFAFVYAPLSLLFDYFGTQRWNLRWQIAWLLSNILIFFMYEIMHLSVTFLFIIYTVKQAILYTIGILYLALYSRKMNKGI